MFPVNAFSLPNTSTKEREWEKYQELHTLRRRVSRVSWKRKNRKLFNPTYVGIFVICLPVISRPYSCVPFILQVGIHTLVIRYRRWEERDVGDVRYRSGTTPQAHWCLLERKIHMWASECPSSRAERKRDQCRDALLTKQNPWIWIRYGRDVVDPDVYPPAITYLPNMSILLPLRDIWLLSTIIHMPFSITKKCQCTLLLFANTQVFPLVQKKKAEKSALSEDREKKDNEDVQSLSDQVSWSAMACSSLSRSTFLGPQARISWSFPAL